VGGPGGCCGEGCQRWWFPQAWLWICEEASPHALGLHGSSGPRSQSGHPVVMTRTARPTLAAFDLCGAGPQILDDTPVIRGAAERTPDRRRGKHGHWRRGGLGLPLPHKFLPEMRPSAEKLALAGGMVMLLQAFAAVAADPRIIIGHTPGATRTSSPRCTMRFSAKRGVYGRCNACCISGADIGRLDRGASSKRS
jgi:hypothetical protein